MAMRTIKKFLIEMRANIEVLHPYVPVTSSPVHSHIAASATVVWEAKCSCAAASRGTSSSLDGTKTALIHSAHAPGM
eukprot:7277582-Prymnesium_polylepis.1